MAISDTVVCVVALVLFCDFCYAYAILLYNCFVKEEEEEE